LSRALGSARRTPTGRIAKGHFFDGFFGRRGFRCGKLRATNFWTARSKSMRNRSAETLVEVRDSSIHGKGTFASTLLESDTLILEYTGEVISRKTAVERDQPDAPDYSCYILLIDDDVFIDARLVEHPAKYINHSCEPNCILSLQDDKAFILTLRTIQPGEELTYDYDYDPSENVKCFCQARGCRGRI
jgi:SET domain-containing protein